MNYETYVQAFGVSECEQIELRKYYFFFNILQNLCNVHVENVTKLNLKNRARVTKRTENQSV